jgi:hypothetical protein
MLPGCADPRHSATPPRKNINAALKTTTWLVVSSFTTWGKCSIQLNITSAPKAATLSPRNA